MLFMEQTLQEVLQHCLTQLNKTVQDKFGGEPATAGAYAEEAVARGVSSEDASVQAENFSQCFAKQFRNEIDSQFY